MDVIISMAAKGQKIIYHRQNCMYVEKMKPQNRMVLSQKTVKKQRFCSCLYCGGLKGELRTNPQFSAWEKEYGIAIDYIEKNNALYVRTKIGCWKLWPDEETDKYLLFHRNMYNKDMTLAEACYGAYHRQRDVKPMASLHQLINYIVAHDRAKVIIMDNYRKLPRTTAKQKKYYRQTENKIKRRERKQAQQRIDYLFKLIAEGRA